MTPRAVYDQVHFPLLEDQKYFYEDGVYIHRLAEIGYRAAILKGVRCYHATGVWWNARYQEYWAQCHEGNPEELRKMKLFVEKGVLIKDAVRPPSVRKFLGDIKRRLIGLWRRCKPSRVRRK